MDKQSQIWALKDKRGDLKDSKSNLQWALNDDKSDLRELNHKISEKERRQEELESLSGSSYDWGGPVRWGGSLEDQLASAKNKLQTTKRQIESLQHKKENNGGWMTDDTEEDEQIDAEIAKLARTAHDEAVRVGELEAELAQEQAEKQRRKQQRENELTEVKAQLYRLRSNKQSLETLIERREARISELNRKISEITAKLRDLGDW